VQGSLPMATNKNQHFVPRCYLRPFTLDGGNAAINVFNVDRLRFITGAPVKNQCSGDYFYGEDLALERALQTTEGEYAGCLSRILSASRALTDEDKLLLLRFWLLQYLRTEAASRRSVEMAEGMRDLVGAPDDFGMSIKEAAPRANMTCYTYPREISEQRGRYDQQVSIQGHDDRSERIARPGRIARSPQGD
jgi:hypothetical protein